MVLLATDTQGDAGLSLVFLGACFSKGVSANHLLLSGKYPTVFLKWEKRVASDAACLVEPSEKYKGSCQLPFALYHQSQATLDTNGLNIIPWHNILAYFECPLVFQSFLRSAAGIYHLFSYSQNLFQS